MPDHREACRRRHRIVANWLVLYTWKLRADCIVLDRDDLGALLSVLHIKESRKEWLVNDVESWFPYHETIWTSSNVLASIFLSRVPLDDLALGTMSDQERIERTGQKLRIIKLRSSGTRQWRLPTEEEMASQMMMVASGMSPISFPNPVEKLRDHLYLSPGVVRWLEAKGHFYDIDKALCAYMKKEKEKDNERRATRRVRVVGKVAGGSRSANPTEPLAT
jgi:hypothetical protein